MAAQLTPQLSESERITWAERILRENNQTERDRDIILARVQHRGADRTRILGNNRELICAYLILSMNDPVNGDSEMIINPITGRLITINREVYNRLLSDCNLRGSLSRRPAASRPTTPQPVSPQEQAPAARTNRIQQLNARMSRQELTQWARSVVGEVIPPGMITTSSEYRDQILLRYNTDRVRQLMAELRTRRENLTPEEVCAYLILSNYQVNPRTGQRIIEGAPTLTRLLRDCNLRQRTSLGMFRTPLVEERINIFRTAANTPLPGDVLRVSIAPTPSTSREPLTPQNEQFNAESILNQCNNTFGHIANAEGNHFQELGKNMLKACSKVLEPEVSERHKPNAFVPRINRVRQRIARAIPLRQSQITIYNVDTKNILPFVFNSWLQEQILFGSLDSYFKANFRGFYIIQNQFYGVGIDAGGVSRDILSSLAEQIALFTSEGFPNPECGANAEKLFIETSEGSGRYTLNHKFILTDFKMNIPDITPAAMRSNADLQVLENGTDGRDGYRQINERLHATFPTGIEKTNALFKFIGEYYIFCIINNIPININLSRSLLAFIYISFIPSENRTDDYMNGMGKKMMTYYLMDYSHSPGLAKTIIARDGYMMHPDIYLTEPGANASDVNIAGTFNGYQEQFFPNEPHFNLIITDEPVTRDNLANYIYRVVIADELGIAEPRRQKHQYLMSLIGPMIRLYDILYHAIRKKPLLTLDLLLSGYIMPNKPGSNERLTPYPAIHQFTNADKESMKYVIYKKIIYDELTDQDRRISQWFKEILFNYGSDYPTNDTPEQKEQLFIEFFKKLIKFWTGTPVVPVSTDSLRLVFIQTEGTARRLPMAHTCFNTLDIPTNIENKADLYNRLLTAVYQGNQGIALAGGRKKYIVKK